MSTFGNPARYACCFGEHEEASPWEPLHVEHASRPARARWRRSGRAAGRRGRYQSRKAADVLATITRTLEVVATTR